jgi:von Willebrand factor type A domain
MTSRRSHSSAAPLVLSVAIASGVAIILSLTLAGCTFSPGKPGAESGQGGNAISGSGNNGGGLTGGGPTGSGGGGVLTDASSPTPTADANCGQVNNPLRVVPPDILIVQDKSGSMSNDDNDAACQRGGCGANSKWSQVTTALNQVVMNTQATVNWGLKFFSDDGACGSSAAPVVPVGSGSAMAIATAIGRASPGGNTPTRDAVTSGASYLSQLTDSSPKYLLLATDGLPNCPVGCAGTANLPQMCTVTDNPSEDGATEQAVANAVTMGFKVFVIGIGNVSSAVTTLNKLAVNGGEAQSGAATSYYAATDPTSLEDALNAIVGKVASCTLPLPSKPQVPDNVVVEDVETKTTIPQDTSHTNGWDYTDATDTAIQLYGTACEDVTNGTYTDVEIFEGCPGMQIIIS